jgi:hypothetical protein
VRPAQPNHELTELATGFTVRNYQDALHAGDASRALIADAIHRRFTERYLDPALGVPQHGFTMMAIACLMIEALECFRQGLPTSRNISQPVFTAFVAWAPPLAVFASERNALYANVRCGILHQAETRGGWKILRQGPLFDLPTRTINAIAFLDALRQILHDYCEGLKTTRWDSPEWENVRARMNAICANCQP